MLAFEGGQQREVHLCREFPRLSRRITTQAAGHTAPAGIRPATPPLPRHQGADEGDPARHGRTGCSSLCVADLAVAGRLLLAARVQNRVAADVRRPARPDSRVHDVEHSAQFGGHERLGRRTSTGNGWGATSTSRSGPISRSPRTSSGLRSRPAPHADRRLREHRHPSLASSRRTTGRRTGDCRSAAQVAVVGC